MLFPGCTSTLPNTYRQHSGKSNLLRRLKGKTFFSTSRCFTFLFPGSLHLIGSVAPLEGLSRAVSCEETVAGIPIPVRIFLSHPFGLSPRRAFHAFRISVPKVLRINAAELLRAEPDWLSDYYTRFALSRVLYSRKLRIIFKRRGCAFQSPPTAPGREREGERDTEEEGKQFCSAGIFASI